MENRPLFERCIGVVLHAPLFDEEHRAKLGLNLAEQGAPANKQFRHFIPRRHDEKATGRDLVNVSDREYL